MSYDLDPEKRQGLLETAAMEGAQTISGLTLRPMTLGTWSLHRRIRAAANDNLGDDWSFDLMSFVYLHQAPEDRLRGYFGRPDALLPEIYDFMATRPSSDVPLFQPWVKTQMEQFTATLTSSESVAPSVTSSDPKT
jgi:hypothetical protein